MDSEFPDEGDAEAEALAEAAALQLPAKLESKKWKIRGLGYSEVEAIFDDPNTPDDELQRSEPPCLARPLDEPHSLKQKQVVA